MLLTTLEIWVACDKSACRYHSHLSDYDPEVPYERDEVEAVDHEDTT